MSSIVVGEKILEQALNSLQNTFNIVDSSLGLTKLHIFLIFLILLHNLIIFLLFMILFLNSA